MRWATIDPDGHMLATYPTRAEAREHGRVAPQPAPEGSGWRWDGSTWVEAGEFDLWAEVLRGR